MEEQEPQDITCEVTMKFELYTNQLPVEEKN